MNNLAVAGYPPHAALIQSEPVLGRAEDFLEAPAQRRELSAMLIGEAQNWIMQCGPLSAREVVRGRPVQCGRERFGPLARQAAVMLADRGAFFEMRNPRILVIDTERVTSVTSANSSCRIATGDGANWAISATSL